jgi:hypothetical protein
MRQKFPALRKRRFELVGDAPAAGLEAVLEGRCEPGYRVFGR